MSLVFGLDFDDTFTACPSVWVQFLETASQQGHRIYIVTARRDTAENRQAVNEFLKLWEVSVPVVYTSLGSKIHAMESRGVKVDIWIDDNPHALVHGH